MSTILVLEHFFSFLGAQSGKAYFCMWILKCALHFFTRLLRSVNSTESCSLQSLKVQLTDATYPDSVFMSSDADTRGGHCQGSLRH